MITTDDALARVDRHFLGPPGKTMPFRPSYTAIYTGAAVFFTIFVVARALLHVPLGFQPLAIMLAATVVITSRITRYVTPDRPLRSVVKAAWNDLNAPRPPKPGQTFVVELYPMTCRSTDTTKEHS